MKIIHKISVILSLVTGYSQANTSLLVQRAVSSHEQQILKIDPVTGNSEVVAILNGLSGGTSSIAIDEPNSRCFVIGYDLQSNHRLYEIDLKTGTVISNPILSVHENIGDPYYNTSDNMIYAQSSVSSNEQLVLKIDPITGAARTIADITGLSGGTTALTVDPISKRCFCFGYNNQSQQKMFVIDMQNEKLLVSLVLSIGGSLADPFYNSNDGLIYVQKSISINEQEIYKIDPVSGKTTLISTLSEHFGSTSALTIDPANHVCYLSGYDSQYNHNMYTIDITSGILMAVTPLSVKESFGDPVIMGTNDINIAKTASVFDNLNVYPNPSNGMFSVSSAVNIPGQINVEIFDALGEKVYEKVGLFSNFSQIDLSAIRSGEYFVRFYGNNDACTKRISIVN